MGGAAPAGRLGRILFDRFVRSREIAPEALTPVDRQAHVGRTGNHRGTACYGQRGPEHRARQTMLCLAGPHAGEELQPQTATAPSCGLRICNFASRLGVSIRAFQHRFDRLNRRARDRPAGLDQHAIKLVRNTIEAHLENGGGLLMVSHDEAPFVHLKGQHIMIEGASL